MSQEKYTNHYANIIKATLDDQINRNFHLQATVKVQEEVLIESVTQIENLTQQLEDIQKGSTESIQQKEKDLLNQIDQLNKQYKREIDTLSNRASGLDETQTKLYQATQQVEQLKNEITFLEKGMIPIESLKNQLLNTQNTVREKSSLIVDLQKQIDDLKSPPIPKKVIKKPESTLELISEDGGNF